MGATAARRNDQYCWFAAVNEVDHSTAGLMKKHLVLSVTLSLVLLPLCWTTPGRAHDEDNGPARLVGTMSSLSSAASKSWKSDGPASDHEPASWIVLDKQAEEVRSSESEPVMI